MNVCALAALLDDRRFGDCRDAAANLLRNGDLGDCEKAQVFLALSYSLAALQSGQEAVSPAELAVYFARLAGEYDLAGRALCHLAALYGELGLHKRTAAALDEFFQSFGLYQLARSLEGWVLSRLGQAYQAMGRGPKALEYFRRAYHWHLESGASPSLVEEQRGYLTLQLLQLGQLDAAKELLAESALHLQQAPNDLEARACYLNNQAYRSYLLGSYSSAIDTCVQVLQMRSATARWKARACLTLHYAARSKGLAREAMGFGTLARIQASVARLPHLEEEATRSMLHMQQHDGLPLMDELLRSVRQPRAAAGTER